MRQASLYRYTLPIKTGVVLRHRALLQRQGLFLHLQQDGSHGWGEISPLPSFSIERLVTAEQQVNRWLDGWLNGQEDTLDDFSPSVAFGVSIAQAELAGELGEQGYFTSALLCGSYVESWPTVLPEVGVTQVKMKIGLASPTEEGEAVNQFLCIFPQARLRLDANRVWSLAQAVEFGKKIAKPYRLQIDFIEEPCQSIADSMQFAKQCGIRIAWDESLREQRSSQESGFALLEQSLQTIPSLLAAIVIKPTLTGSLFRCLRLIEQAQCRGLQTVISSSLESSLGLSQLARIAQQFTPNTLPGLDTLNLMPVQLLRRWPGSSLPLVGIDSEFIQPLRLET